MKKYKITFGVGEDAVTLVNNPGVNIVRALIPLIKTGWKIADITKIEESYEF